MTNKYYKLLTGALACLLLAGCGKKEAESEIATDAIEETQASAPLNTKCDPANNPDIDCGCVTNLVEGAWHDDPDLDMTTVLAKSEEEFSQPSIDALIDIALDVDEKCADGN